MRLTVVGCAGSFPGRDSAASCHLVEAEGFRLLLDLGNGALGSLQHHLGLYDVDAVTLSHLHPDHCVDLASYHVARMHRPEGRPPRIPVLGPAGTADRLARVLGVPERPGLHQAFDFQTLVPGTVEVGPFRVIVDRVDHPVETFAMRLEHLGATLAYSGDTGPSEALVGIARDADLLLCEAGFADGADNPPGLHLTGGQAGAHAARAGVGRLVLTHMVPAWHDPERSLAAAVAAYTGPVMAAHPGATYDV